MKCPNCGKEIANDSQFCEFCGTNVNFVGASTPNNVKPKRKKNGWIFVSIILFLSNIVCGWLAYDYNDILWRERSYVRDLESAKNSLEYEVNSLRELVPKSYKTKYNNQQLYYRTCYGTFSLLGCNFSEKNTVVSIYQQVNDYGLTDWGWIPMNRLEMINK